MEKGRRSDPENGSNKRGSVDKIDDRVCGQGAYEGKGEEEGEPEGKEKNKQPTNLKGGSKMKEQERSSNEMTPKKINEIDEEEPRHLVHEKKEGKLTKGLHILSDMTKEITEEVLKHVLSRLEGDHEEEDEGKRGSKEDSREKPAIVEQSKGESSNTQEEKKKKITEQGATSNKDEEVKTIATVKKREEMKGSETDKNNDQSANPQTEEPDPAPTPTKTTLDKKEHVKGKEKEKEKVREGGESSSKIAEPSGKPAVNNSEFKQAGPGVDCNSSEMALLQALRRHTTTKGLYLGTASYLADQYPSIVSLSSKEVNKALDIDFVAGSETQALKVSNRVLSRKF